MYYILLIITIIIIILLIFNNFEYFNYNIKVFEEKKTTHTGYNLGDLFNMPHYYVDIGGYRDINTNKNFYHHNYYQEYFLPACKDFEGNTILSYYCKSRELEDINEPVPNIGRFRDSVDEYIYNNLDNKELLRLIYKVINPNTLCIHIRSGDKGVIEKEFIDIVKKVSVNYDYIIFLCGIHADESHLPFDISKENLKRSLDSLVSLINKEYEINFNKTDYHIVLMRKAKNLLLHKGGFSMLGALLSSANNLYISDFFNGRDNPDFMCNIVPKITFV